MDNEKKEIIIKEIYHWKDSKLLPDTYCDFLLALYTEGNHEDEISNISKELKTPPFFLIGAVLILFMISVLVTYFTELLFVLQTVTTGFLLLSSIFVTAFLIKRKTSYQIALVISFIQLLLASLSFVEYTTAGNQFWIAVSVILNCLLWIVTGGLLRIYYLLVSGIIALVIFGITAIY